MKRLLIIFLIILSALLLPFLLWIFDSNEKLQVAIIDKTVPDESYREHLGITWVLNHFGYVKNDGTSYQPASDFFGFVPNEAEKSYHINPLPDSYEEMDVIYLADTYGVYDYDLPWVMKEREGARSSFIYGGMEAAEWQTIMERLQQKKRSTLIVEFNTLASPTSDDVSKSMSDYLEINWTGWIGRYFEELDPGKNEEIPQWILDEFHNSWNYKGPGFLLVNDRNSEVVVIEKGKHFKGDGIKLQFTEKGKEKFNMEESPYYQYWFDIVTPKSGADVLADYKWNLTEDGKEIIEDKGIPLKFAGILESQHQHAKSYYFAGDFNDISTTPIFYKMKGLSKIYKLLHSFSEDSFYWSAYVPIMKTILSESKENMEENTFTNDENEVMYTARVGKDSFEILVENEWKDITIKGVNMGMGKPGKFPGEAAITEEEYYRWLTQIGEMGANAIRVYTLHPPEFYQSLKRYNDEHQDKIYVFHGIWINEEKLEDTLDAFDQEMVEDFQNEMKDIVDVIHGNALIKPRPGHSSGIYRADVSQYVIGWIIGIEWYPYMVQNTNDTHDALGEYDGKNVKTNGASPFEYWLAEQLDVITSYEKEQYNWIRPVSFTNWVTTDLLEHPSEPMEEEDLVSVNPNVIVMKGDLKLTEQFASYHVYPYYPDFFNLEKEYLEFIDHRGENNSYAAYLKELKEAHKMPILIAEFGVPASRGMTHENPFGWNQGFLSEKEQGEIITRLFEDILHQNMLGGLVFTWQDEWFKRTWNTMDYDNPDRRPFWSNAQTNEQQFGLLSFDRHKIKVDGSTSDWGNMSPLYEKSEGALKALYMDYDERYLYFRLDLQDVEQGYPAILLDTMPGQGNKSANMLRDVTFHNGVDYLINIKGKESRVLVDAYYDFFTYQYTHQLKLFQPADALPENDSGIFQPLYFALNKELYHPKTNEILPFHYYETGKLLEGNGNPDSEAYHSLADYFVNKEKGIIELRIPWLLLNVKDPSQKEIMGNFYADGQESSLIINGINAGVVFVEKDGTVADSFPSLQNGVVQEMKQFTWNGWEEPFYEERLKESYYILKKAFTSQTP